MSKLNGRPGPAVYSEGNRVKFFSLAASGKKVCFSVVLAVGPV